MASGHCLAGSLAATGSARPAAFQAGGACLGTPSCLLCPVPTSLTSSDPSVSGVGWVCPAGPGTFHLTSVLQLYPRGRPWWNFLLFAGGARNRMYLPDFLYQLIARVFSLVPCLGFVTDAAVNSGCRCLSHTPIAFSSVSRSGIA